MTDENLVAAMQEGRKIALPYFSGAPVVLDFEDEIELLEFGDVIRNFLYLEEADRLRDTRHAWAYFVDLTDDVGMDHADQGMGDLAIGSVDIWDFVSPRYLHATNCWDLGNRDVQRAYVIVDNRCGWEAEHGMLMSWRGGTDLVKVSGYDGHPTNGHAFNDLQMDQWVYCGNNPRNHTARLT